MPGIEGVRQFLHTPLLKYLGVLTFALLTTFKANSTYLLALAMLPDLTANKASEYNILAL